ncbi:hypothetical protein AJ78_04903 [Emergomyces pasteurianus Ep9510]|uniref:G protein-coupled receptor GPR1/2/3 C-terminal domain-containing protein n=1 Tax=Emergomyces pasteurianus Ep9510 TaxID=1447872 RepID=A0A1J9QHV4_9EURO|nr:hypothetical protein AJ78_04903 [Emergomyces pasteurianus Ep9510]
MSALDLQRRSLADPRVISPLPSENRRGIIAIFICSLLSTIATSSVLLWLTYRLVFWRRFYTRYPGNNQFIVLIFNLLLADLHQASSFMISPAWLRMDQISAYSPACFAQGWLINFGDVASGLFVLAIAAHTFSTVIMRKTLRHGVFVGCVVGLWIFCLVLTAIAPAVRGRYVFMPTGAWCWIDRKFGDERLYLHYFWIFFSEIGIIIIYPTLFFVIRHRLKSSREFQGTRGMRRPKFNRVLKIMIIYPIAYVIISLPIAAGRMSMMSGHSPAMSYIYASGCILMCSGWVDSILYFLTRRRVLEADLPTEVGSDSTQKCDVGYHSSPTTGGGLIRAIDSRRRPSPVFVKNSRTPQTASSSTDNIIDPVELSELGQLNPLTMVGIPHEPARVAASSSSSSSSSQPPTGGFPAP